MSLYFYPLMFLKVIIDAPGDYLTRGGNRVTVVKASTRNDSGCNGFYTACKTPEHWHKSGRIFASRETQNDIVQRA